MSPTIREMALDGNVCQSFDLVLIQEVISPHLVQLALSVSDAWEERERRLNMQTLIYWLIALALYPQLSQRAVYSKVLSGLWLVQPDVAKQVPVKSAFSYRREQLAVAPLEWLFALCAYPRATPETPRALWKGLRLSSRRQGETSSAREVLARSLGPDMLLLWDSGLHRSSQIFLARQRQSHVLGALKSNVLTKPVERLVDGSYLTYIYEDQDHHAGARLLAL